MSKGSHHVLGEDFNGVLDGFYNQIEQVTPKTVSQDNCTSQLITADDTERQFVTRSVYRRRRKRLWGRFTRKFLAYFFVLTVIAVPVALLAMKSLGPCKYNTILSFNRNDIVPFLTTRNSSQYQLRDDENVTSFQVSLFGDSLINKPFMNLDLEGKMKTYLPQFSLDITNVASNGCKISNMRDRLEHIIEADPKPDAVLLYWDSDVSDVDESRMSSDEVDDLRSKYRSDLSYLLSELASNITYVALAGPGILGEGPMFMPKSDRFTKDKTDMLNSYREMNKDLAEEHAIPYIDMRQAFLDAIPSYRLNYKHCVTYDGEHENEYGTLIVAELLSRTIFEWIKDLDAINEPKEPDVLNSRFNGSAYARQNTIT